MLTHNSELCAQSAPLGIPLLLHLSELEKKTEHKVKLV
jgi:hypothetical protein